MKIYAVRDRLIDYFLVPFAAHEDKQVQAAISKTINNGVNNDDIAKAPSHFEIWCLAQVTDDGHIVEDRYLVCNCSSLVRGGVRDSATTALDRDPEAPGAEVQHHRAPENLGIPNGAHKPPAPHAAPSAGRPTEEISAGHRRMPAGDNH